MVDQSFINLGGLRWRCDYVLDSPPHIPRERLKQYFDGRLAKVGDVDIERIRTIYLSTDAISYIEQFLQRIESLFTGTFVVDTRDVSLTKKPDWIGGAASWAAPHISNPFSSSGLCIPVGLEERRLLTNNLPWLFNETNNKFDKILVGPFAKTHSSRILFFDMNSSNTITKKLKRLSPLSYSYVARKYKFIACPRGNGIDTHRVWESLKRKAVPIVLDNEWSRYFIQKGIPMLALQDFQEMYSFSERQLSDFYEQRLDLLERNHLLFTNSFWMHEILHHSNQSPKS